MCAHYPTWIDYMDMCARSPMMRAAHRAIGNRDEWEECKCCSGHADSATNPGG